MAYSYTIGSAAEQPKGNTMARFILVDSSTGYIFGDTSDFAASQQIDSPEHAAQLLDEHIGAPASKYELMRNRANDAPGYFVYRADINGSDAVPVVCDGQDQATIDGVTDSCEFVGFVERSR